MARKYAKKLEEWAVIEDRLQVGDTVDSKTIKDITGRDPEDLPDNVHRIQTLSMCASEIIGHKRLFETFTRLGNNDAWVYVGLCEKEEVTNCSPAEARRVFICSPYAQDPEWSIRFARAACREAFINGCLPVAPHLYFTRFLHEGGDGFERKYGIAAGHELMRDCDEIVVYAIDGKISSGMRSDIDFAINQLALQPTVIRMTKADAEQYMKIFLDDENAIHGMNSTEE